MEKSNIDITLENQSLKDEIISRGLEPSLILDCFPEGLIGENILLRKLLDWATAYRNLGGKSGMIANGYTYPPVFPCISPESDWYRFERWMEGKPLRKQIKQLLPNGYDLKHPFMLAEEEIEPELERLLDALYQKHVAYELHEGMPPRLAYEYLWQSLDEEMDLLGDGWWVMDGCSGFCPGCLQRPWCEFGVTSCWIEDEKAGTMHLADTVKKYVSASPVSLKILSAAQEKTDKEFEEWKRSNPDGEISLTPLPLDFE